MRNKPDIVQDSLFNAIDNDFELTMIESSIKVSGLSRSDAEYQVSRNINGLWKLFSTLITNHASEGRYPYIIITDKLSKRFRNFTTILANDSNKQILTKAKLKRRKDIYSFIDSLHWRSFEALSCVLLDLLGSRQTHITEPGNEFGVDFLGIVPAYGAYHLFPNKKKEVRVIGQSKMWNNGTPRDRVDLLDKTISNVKSRNVDYLDKFPSWLFRSMSSIQGMVISQNGYQSGAINSGKDNGILLVDGYDITDVVATHYDLGLTIEDIKDDLDIRMNTYL